MKKKNKTTLLKPLMKVLPVLMIMAVVAYGGMFVSEIEIPTVLPVDNVQVHGELKFLDKNEIETIVRNNISGGYFTVDLANVRSILMHKPWVKNISLRRKWPASLSVYVDEQVPVAYWNDDAYLSEKGEIFKPVKINKTLNLPALNGPEGQQQNVWKFMNVLYRETALLDYEVVQLVLDERRAWQLLITANDGSNNEKINVRLGRFDTEKRMRRFIRILPALASASGLPGAALLENRIKQIDMRYPNGFAVQMSQHEAISKNNKNLNFSHEFESVREHAPVQTSEA